MNKIYLAPLLFLILACNNATAQVSINTSSSLPHPSAMLDVSSASKGMLVPRMDSASRAGISSPATGLLVYQTNGSLAGFYYFDGSSWLSLSSPVGPAGGNLSGSYPDPSIASLPAISGANLTGLNADNLSSGTVPVARLGTGTASSATYLRGDQTWQTPAGPPTVILKDVKAAGTNGGTFFSGAWQTRTINTIEGDLSFATLATNTFILQPGTYHVRVEAPANRVANHQARLFNLSTVTVVKYGSSSYSDPSITGVSVSIVECIITVATTSVFRVEHRCASTEVADGFGIACGFGNNEVYTQVVITKTQ